MSGNGGLTLVGTLEIPQMMYDLVLFFDSDISSLGKKKKSNNHSYPEVSIVRIGDF